MPLQYKRIDGPSSITVYDGFRPASEKHIYLPGEALVMVWFEGDPECYVTDGTPEAISELRRFYMDDFNVDNLTIVSYTPNLGFNGPATN